MIDNYLNNILSNPRKELLYFILIFVIIYYIFFSILDNKNQIKLYKVIILLVISIIIYNQYLNSPESEIDDLNVRYKFLEDLVGENINIYKNPYLLNFFYETRHYYIFDRKNYKDSVKLACKLINLNEEYRVLNKNNYLKGTDYVDNMRDISKELINTYGSIVNGLSIQTKGFSENIIRLQKIIRNYVLEGEEYINNNIVDMINTEVVPNDKNNYANNNFNYYL
jgi:hypothetical protein